MPSFTHLHVHTQYSLLDGAARLKDLFAACAEHGMTHLAISDHGNLHGAYDFFHQAQKAGITPIIGIEAYVAPASRRTKERVFWGQPHQKRDDVSGSGGYTHKTIWARDATGLHNLFRLSSDAYQEGWLQKWPRMDKDSLAQWSEGLIASTGCPSGEVQTRLRLGQYDAAVEAAAQYQDIFGKENYFLELMDHGIEIERRVRDGLLDLGRALGIPPLVTNDSHYTHAAEAKAHDALLCIQTGKSLADPDRFRFDGSGYYLKSAAEMYAVDASDAWQDGCRNTLMVAERIDTTGMFTKRDLMPRFAVPEGFTEVTWFRDEVLRGMHRRYPDGWDERYQKLVEYEMDVVIQMGFPGYFLVVADFIMWAKGNDIAVGPGRGSAAGSLVSYALGITDLDPIEHGLIFERFLNPERVSMPDVDIDFDERRRVEVIRYVTEKYGADKVAMIGTYGTIKAKNAIKDSARVLGLPYATGDRITKAMPADVGGSGIDLTGITDPKHPRYDEAAEVRSMYENDPDVRTVIDTAKGVEGLVRQMGVHAAGVIMSSESIVDHVPVWVRHSDGVTITQWDYPSCESLGLLKMDFLGLRNLTVIDDAVKMVRATKGLEIELLRLPLDDARTFQLLGRGDTLGVFQFDGTAMRALLRLMRPDQFEDITAVTALYRPGPMAMNSHTNYALRKNGQQEITPIHPELEEPLREVLGITYGLVVYQEQVQKAAQILAGYSLGQADLLRRAMGKKKKEVLDQEFVPFRDGCRQHGFSDVATQAVWDVLVPFAGYAYNKAHAAAYALVSYWTAPEGESSGRVHGGVADLGEGRQGQVRGVSERVPADGDQGAATRHQRVARELRSSRGGRGALRALRRTEHRVGGRRRHHPRPRGRAVRVVPGLSREGGVRCLQQACDRVADPGRCFRHTRAYAQGLAREARGPGRERRRGQAEGGRGAVRSVRYVGIAGVHARRELRGGRVGQGGPAGARAGDARAVCVGPSAVRPRGSAPRAFRRGDRSARRSARRCGGDDRRDHLRAAAAGDEEGRSVGHGNDRGSRWIGRVPVLPGDVPVGVRAVAAGRGGVRERAVGQAGRRTAADRFRGDGS